MNSRVVSLLSICRKAGKLAVGFDLVKESIRDGKAHLVVLAGDLSPKTAKQIQFEASRNPGSVRVLQLPETMFELSNILGRKAGVMSVTDAGLAGSILQTAGKPNREE